MDEEVEWEFQRQYLSRWKNLGLELDQIRDREISRFTAVDTQQAIQALDAAYGQQFAICQPEQPRDWWNGSAI